MAKIMYEGIKDRGMTDESVCRGLYNATKKLRDRWLDMLTNIKRGRRPVRQISEPLTTTAQNVNNKDQRDRSLRDTSMSDEDEEAGSMHRVLLYWILYVHYDV